MAKTINGFNMTGSQYNEVVNILKLTPRNPQSNLPFLRAVKYIWSICKTATYNTYPYGSSTGRILTLRELGNIVHKIENKIIKI